MNAILKLGSLLSMEFTAQDTNHIYHTAFIVKTVIKHCFKNPSFMFIGSGLLEIPSSLQLVGTPTSFPPGIRTTSMSLFSLSKDMAV